ncbi:hypothetical protein [Streptomyces sp. NPDC001401]|uniref:hypothetical protein n=1 Tax=Streptomyces sp. NPDC001401 TaxID=3364570 RepID=UPI00367918D6
MGGFLSELGKRLAERWLSLLALPGALYLAVAALAVALGHDHPFDVPRLTRRVSDWAAAPAAHTVGGQLVFLAATLAAAAAVGLLAQALGSLTERACLAADWRGWSAAPRRLAAAVVDRRQRRWRQAQADYQRLRDTAARRLARGGGRVNPAPRHAAYRAMVRVSVECPDRPTWSGDRVHSVAVRLERDLHMDLASVWPPLWLTLPDTARVEIAAARQALTRACLLPAWAALYLLLAVWWWPATFVALGLVTAARLRIRVAVDSYALLLDASVRLHAGNLARTLGLDLNGPLDRDTGDRIGRLLGR